MNYRQEYEKWLASPALSEDERNELKAIANDERRLKTASTVRSNSARPAFAARCTLAFTT